MDRRDFAGILFAVVPSLGIIFAERLAQEPMDSLIESGWAPFAVAVVAVSVWLVYVFGARRILGPTRGDLQEALDQLLNYYYKEDGQGNPRPGISGEGIIRERAPYSYREDWYKKLGLGKPRKRSQYG